MTGSQFRKIVALLLVSIMISGFIAGCSSPDENGTPMETSVSPTVPSEEPPSLEEELLEDLTEPQELLTVFIEPSSEEYENTGEVTESLDTGLEADMTTPVRFISAVDGVTVRLERGSWNPYHAFYEVTDEIFSVEAKTGEVYSFDGVMSETIPHLQLVAEYRGLQCIWPLQYDMVEGSVVFSLTGKPWEAQPLDETSNIINLCAAYAITYYTGSRVTADDGYFSQETVATEEVWPAVAMAITLNHTAVTQEEYFEDNLYVGEDVLFSYARAMFPDVELPPVPEGDFEPSSDGYMIMPILAPTFWEFVYVYKEEEAETPFWQVAIGMQSAEDGWTPITFVVNLEENEEYDRDNPFEYHVTGIAILGGDTP